MKLFIITGQTATGKTDYALQLAQQYDGELINCDSRQIYKGLDIITGKDRPKDVKVWLYDIIDPKKYFSSYDFVTCAIKVLQNILSRGKTPIIVGGTYFYLYHLLYNVETDHIPPDWELRNKLNLKPVAELQEILETLIQSFNLPAGRQGQLNNSDKNNPQRLIRKIEIASFSSFNLPYSPLSSHYQTTLKQKLNLKNLDIQFIGLRFKNKDKLHQRITKRVEERLKNGAVEEVKALLKKDYRESDPGLKTIGYSQLIKYMKGETTIKLATEQWISKEVQYAKRQYTFMKKDPHIVWKEII